MLRIEYKTWANYETAGDERSPVFMPMYPDETVTLKGDVVFRLFMWTDFYELRAVEDWISRFGPYDAHPSSYTQWEEKRKEMQKAWQRSRKSRQTARDRILYQAAIDDHLRDCHLAITDAGTLVVECDDLLAAMWMQMAFAISEGTSFRACRSCQKPLSNKRLQNAKVCSDCCKESHQLD